MNKHIPATTSGIRTGAQFLDALNDGREVWYKGKRIADVTQFAPFQGVLKTLAGLYDLQWTPEYRDIMTYETPDGLRASKSYLLPQTREQLLERRANHEVWGSQTFGQMGRNPDFCGGITIGLMEVRHELAKLDPMFARNIENYHALCQRKDFCLTHGLHDPNMDKTLRPKQDPDRCLRIVRKTDEGYIVRGARYATLGPFADEILVYPSFMLADDEDEFAIWFAVPMNTKGIRTLCRDSYAAGRDPESFPLSARFDEQDALVIFDDVLVPFDRVFLAGHAKEAVRIYRGGLMTWAGYGSAIHLMKRYELFIGVAHLLAETGGTANRPRVQEELGELVTLAETQSQLFYAGEAAARQTKSGYWAPGGPPSNLAFAILISERMVSLIEHVGTGSMIFNAAPEDFEAEELRPLLEIYGRGKNASARNRQKLVRLAFELTGDAFGSRQQLYERLHSGDPYLRVGNAWRAFDKSAAVGAVNKLLDTKFSG